METLTGAPSVAPRDPDPSPGLSRPCAPTEVLRAFVRAGVFANRARAERSDRAVPPLKLSVASVGSVLADELLVTVFRLRSGDRRVDLAADEIDVAVDRLAAGGYLDSPALLHPSPPAPRDIRLTSRRVFNLRFEHVSFESLYTPPDGMPRAEEWLADASNHLAHAYVLRHDDRPRPWVVVLHGHGAGEPIDLLMMGSRGIMQELGVNILHPVLPMHGPRGRTATNGSFPSPDPLVNLYGLCQGMWDIRKMLAWIRANGATQIGVYGVSLGGHAAALLASLDPGLACAVAGIPSAEFTSMMASHATRFDEEALARSTGLLNEPVKTINQMVSPLALPSLVPRSGRFILAGVGDRITTPEQAVELWRHWEEPAILWVQRGHVGVLAGRAGKAFVRNALRSTGVAA
jgi:pimeloyl-ACP methyl ester carboxylesterase